MKSYNNIQNINKIDFEKMPDILPEGFLKDSIFNLSRTGLPEGYRLGIDSLDDLVRFDTSRLITITGVPNYGKSEFVDFITTSLNKRYGLKTAYFSPENQPTSLHLAKLIAKYTGKKLNLDAYTSEEIESAINYIVKNFFFINYGRITTLDDILALFAKLIERGVQVFVIDPYNKLDSEKSVSEMETEFISKLLDKLCRFAIKHDIMLILVAHPRKMERDRNQGYQIPTAYDINGSANFFNKSDYVLTVHRDILNDEVLIRVSKVKFSHYGKQGDCRLKYDVESGNYYDSTLSSDPLAFLDGDDSENGYVHTPFEFPTKSSKRNPLDVEVSCYKGASDNIGSPINLKDFLFTGRFKGVAEDIRQKATPEERHEYKKGKVHEIPAITISGLFSVRDSKSLISPSGLMCIDIDHKDNTPETMAKVPSILKSLPYVCYSAKSISGDGYFAIIPLENPKHFRQHYNALEEEMKSYGIVIDKSCKDITRLRFATYDDEYYYNPSASSFYLEVDTTQPLDRKQSKQFVSSSTHSDEDRVKSEVEFLKNNSISLPDDYDTWFKLAMSLNSSLGEKGRKYFHELSSLSNKYDKYECDNQYDEVINHYSGDNEVSLGTFFHIVNNAKNINQYES